MEEVEYKKRFFERVYDLVNTDGQDIWSSFRSEILKVCDEVCGVRKGEVKKGNTWW